MITHLTGGNAYSSYDTYLPIFAITYLLKIVVSAYHWNLVGILFQMTPAIFSSITARHRLHLSKVQPVLAISNSFKAWILERYSDLAATL